MYQNVPSFNKKCINKIDLFIHQAAQFLAMFGKNYVKDQPDDSNANLGFDSIESTIHSRVSEVDGLALFLDIIRWEIGWKRESKQNTLSIAGKTQKEIFDWLRGELEREALGVDKLQYITHYTIPKHPIADGLAFPTLDKSAINTWLIMRSNAEVLLTELNQLMGVSSEIRIWPHHFDTGTYYPLGGKRAVGAGWAMADRLHDHPYLYIYGQSEQPVIYEDLPKLPLGEWKISSEWQGALIDAESISASDQQHKLIHDTMESIVDFYKKHLN